MESKDYVGIVRKWWWLVLATCAVTTVLTSVFVAGQPSVYESNVTLVVRPRTVISEDAVRAVDILSSRVEITSTYANIARSRLIKDRAIEQLGLTAEERSGLTVSGGVVTGSNILEIGVQGTDPDAVATFASTVGSETVEYIDGLDEAFQLAILDDARTPKNPIAPKKRFTVMLGAAFGLLLGVSLALLAEKYGWPTLGRERGSRKPRSADRFNIIDRDTGAYNRPYFLLRYDQELARSRHGGPICLGFLDVQARSAETGTAMDPPLRDLRTVADAIGPALRDEDLLAYLGAGSFVVMVPEVDPDYVNRLLGQWAEAIAGPTADGGTWLVATAGVGAFGGPEVVEPSVSHEAPPAADDVSDFEDPEDGQADAMNARDVMLRILSAGDDG